MESLLKSLQRQQNELNKLPEVLDGISVRTAVNWSDTTVLNLFRDTEYEVVNQGFSVAS